MTGTELSSNLGLRLEDSAEGIFTSQMKVNAINSAQKQVVSLIDNKHLAELEVVANNQATSAGVVSFSTASITPIGNGIVGVYDEDNDKWCTRVEPGEVKRLENSYLSGDTTSPVFYVFDETIYVKPTTATIIDIWYINKPTDYTTGTLSSSCELAPALQEVLLDIAESQLWRMDGKGDRGNTVMQNAINVIQMLNGRIIGDETKSVGSAGR